MGMKKCKECGEEISSDAKACPKCGKDSRNFFKKHPILCVIGIIVVLLIVSIAGSDSTDNDAGNKNTLNSGNENIQTTTPEIKKTEYNVGEIYEDDYIAVKYVSKNENFTNIPNYAEVKSGYKVIQATFEFENVGTTDKLVSSYDFTCYADGYNCEEFYYIDDSSFGATLSSGKKTKGNVYFEVPKDAKEITLEYEVDVWSSEKIIFVVK